MGKCNTHIFDTNDFQTFDTLITALILSKKSTEMSYIYLKVSETGYDINYTTSIAHG